MHMFCVFCAIKVLLLLTPSGASAILAPPTSVMTYLLTLWRWQELTYEYREDEAWKTWSTRQRLVDFTQSSAKPLITDIVDSYFRQLLPPLQTVQRKVTASVRDAQLKFDALKDELEAYNQTTVLDAEFIRYVLRLDTFEYETS